MKTFFINNNIASLLVSSLLTALLISTSAQANQTQSDHSNHSLMGSHGMVLIYHPDEGFFASHLPLYHTPHNYQLIYKIQIAEPAKLIELIENDMVTLLPENFHLSRLIAGERFSIETTFFKGHFERGGQANFTGEMTFEKPILTKKVSATLMSEKATIYLAPISKEHAIFAHKIQKSRSFDAIGFVENETLNGKMDTISCDKPLKLNAEIIRAKLETCANLDVKYIESRDFK